MSGGTYVPGNHRLVKAVAWALRRRCGVAAGSKLLVATSGGADSVALLRALAIIAPRRRWQLELTVGHIRHHLRSTEETAQDDRFVSSLAGELGLPLLCADLDLTDAGPGAGGGNVEAVARRRRYRALGDLARSCGAAFVATGHHGDDQLETVLMRLLRGASVKGLSGIAWRRPLSRLEHGDNAPGVALIRPLLAADRRTARSFLESLGQRWHEDRTNADRSRWRARLRHDVLPVLHELRPDASRKAVHMAEHMTEAWHVLAGAIDTAADCVEAGPEGVTLDRRRARDLPRPILIGLLRRLLADAGVSKDKLGGRNVAPIARAIADSKGGRRAFDLGANVRVIVTRDLVQLAVP